MKQKAAVKYIIENNSSVTAAMRAVGYSPGHARNSSNLTKTRGFRELMAKYLPEDYVAQKHRSFLDDDNKQVAVKALDLSYKLRGAYAPVKHLNLNVNASPETRKKARDAIRDALDVE